MERTLTYAALFAALTAALGLLRIELVAGVPITAQSLGVMLAGSVLGARVGGLAILIFVALLALGLPLLSGGANLWSVLYTPRIGYVLGFPVAAFVTGLIVQRTRGLPLLASAMLGSATGGILCLYVIGIPVAAWMNELTLTETIIGAAAFLPGDLIKVAIAGVVTAQLARLRPGAILSRA